MSSSSPTPSNSSLKISIATKDELLLKEGWLRKKSRHLKQWRKRYARIEQKQYLCTYVNDKNIKNCTEKIDLQTAIVQYTIDQPKIFQIHVTKPVNNKNKNNKNNKDNINIFRFECNDISDANQWLKCIYLINNSQLSPNTLNNDKKQDDNDWDLVVADQNNPIANDDNDDNNNNPQNQQISSNEINDLYMKAVSLYQHQHFIECERITKSVLTVTPDHPQATKLLHHLVNKLYDNPDGNNKKNNFKIKKLKKLNRSKFSTNPSISKPISSISSSVPLKGSPVLLKSASSKTKKRGFTLFSRKNKRNDLGNKQKDKHNDNVTNDIDDVNTPLADNDDQKQDNIHPCQIEFKRFLTERIQLDKYYKDLYNRFVKAQYDDIRFIKDFDIETLSKEILLKPLHCKIFIRKKEIFLEEVRLFQEEWLKLIVETQKLNNKFVNVTVDGIIDIFENNGILTFETLYEYIQNKDDLKKVINNNKNGYVVDILWSEMQKIKQKERQRISTVSQSYSRVSVSILGGSGYNDNNNDNNFMFGTSIAEQYDSDNQTVDNINADEGVQPQTTYIG